MPSIHGLPTNVRFPTDMIVSVFFFFLLLFCCCCCCCFHLLCWSFLFPFTPDSVQKCYSGDVYRKMFVLHAVQPVRSHIATHSHPGKKYLNFFLCHLSRFVCSWLIGFLGKLGFFSAWLSSSDFRMITSNTFRYVEHSLSA